MPIIYIKVSSLEYLRIPAMIQFNKVTAMGNMPSKVRKNGESIDSLIFLDLTNPYVMVKESFFTGIHIEIQSKMQNFEPAFLYILFEGSSVVDSYHAGNGGGLKIISQGHISQVEIRDCLFSNNSAVKSTENLKGQGGGLYVEGIFLVLHVTDSHFSANSASDMGLALYTTKGVDVLLSNCTFQYKVKPDDPNKQHVLFVAGRVVKMEGMFRLSIPIPESYVGPIAAFYIGQGEQLNIKTYCPKWYNHDVEYISASTKSKVILNVVYKCIPCMVNYYTTGEITGTFSFKGKENNTLAEIKIKQNEKDSCMPCPYGAICSGNNVIPRPYYWGDWHKGEVVFHQCPKSYCCSGSDSRSCNVYNYCSGNRMGVLCGACKEGFSVSILTGACTSNIRCGRDQWFWLIVILAAMAYALWYTVKDNIFIIFFSLFRILRNCIVSKSISNNGHIEILSFNKRKCSVLSSKDVNNVPSSNERGKDIDTSLDEMNT